MTATPKPPDRDTGRQPDEALLAAARELLRHSDLVNVVPVAISASTPDDSGGRQAHDVHVNIDVSFSIGKGLMANRLRYQIELVADDDSIVGVLDFTLQVDYDVDPDHEPDEAAADFVASTTGRFAAYPYARELAQNLTTRLHLDPLVLGLLPRGAERPSRISQVERAR